MTTATAKVKGGMIKLPRPLKREWQDARVSLQFSGDILVIQKTPVTAITPPRKFKTFKPTKAEVVALKRARENYQQGKYMTLDEFDRRLGFKNQ